MTCNQRKTLQGYNLYNNFCLKEQHLGVANDIKYKQNFILST